MSNEDRKNETHSPIRDDLLKLERNVIIGVTVLSGVACTIAILTALVLKVLKIY
jgi:hypothetical protein